MFEASQESTGPNRGLVIFALLWSLLCPTGPHTSLGAEELPSDEREDPGEIEIDPLVQCLPMPREVVEGETLPSDDGTMALWVLDEGQEFAILCWHEAPRPKS